MRKILFNKKGVSLAELIAVIVVMCLVGSIVGQVLHNVNKNFDWVERQWTIQNEIKFIMDSLLRNSASGSLSTANYVDLFYEDMSKVNGEFKSCSEKIGTFTEGEDGKLIFTKVDTEHIYFFNYNNYFYILDRGEQEAVPFVLNDKIKVDVEFSVSTNAMPLVESTTSVGDVGATRYVEKDATLYDEVERHYVTNSITVKIKSCDDYLPSKYEMESAYALKNMTQGRKVNISDDAFTSAYIAGFSSSVASNDYYDNQILKKEASYPNLNKPANIVRYTSSTSYFAQVDIDPELEVRTTANCATRFLMMNQQFSTPVIDNLHNFRDDVLKGNVFGEFIIEKYYEFSPAVIELAQENEFIEESLRWFVVHFAMLLE